MFSFTDKKETKSEFIGLTSLGITSKKIDQKKVLTFNLPPEYIERSGITDLIDGRL